MCQKLFKEQNVANFDIILDPCYISPAKIYGLFNKNNSLLHA